MSKIIRSIAVLALVMGTLVGFAGAASAQTFPPGPPPGVPPVNPPFDAPGYQLASIIVPPRAAVAGEVTVRCVGFPPDTPVTFTLDGVVLGSTVTDANGDCTFTFRMPDRCGTFTLVASGGGVTRTSTIEVPCPAPPVRAAGALPFTGGDSAPIAQMGIALLAAGALVTLVVRKRRTI
jgi:hypothetical protein